MVFIYACTANVTAVHTDVPPTQTIVFTNLGLSCCLSLSLARALSIALLSDCSISLSAAAPSAEEKGRKKKRDSRCFFCRKLIGLVNPYYRMIDHQGGKNTWKAQASSGAWEFIPYLLL